MPGGLENSKITHIAKKENFQDKNMEKVTYQLTRSKRKSLSIMIGKDGTIQVKAPNWLPKYRIDQFIQQKADWIEEKRSEIHILEQKKAAHTFQEGDSFFFLGETYRLTVRHMQHVRVRETVMLRQRERLLVVMTEDITPAGVKKQLEQWYIRQAKELFSDRSSYFYQLVVQEAEKSGKQVNPVNRITIRNQKTRWGSCSSKGNLNYNWRLLMAPAWVLDYVVVHELCHLVYLNHSRQFWQLVEQILPDYRNRREWLKINGILLEWEEPK